MGRLRAARANAGGARRALATSVFALTRERAHWKCAPTGPPGNGRPAGRRPFQKRSPLPGRRQDGGRDLVAGGPFRPRRSLPGDARDAGREGGAGGTREWSVGALFQSARSARSADGQARGTPARLPAMRGRQPAKNWSSELDRAQKASSEFVFWPFCHLCELCSVWRSQRMQNSKKLARGPRRRGLKPASRADGSSKLEKSGRAFSRRGLHAARTPNRSTAGARRVRHRPEQALCDSNAHSSARGDARPPMQISWARGPDGADSHTMLAVREISNRTDEDARKRSQNDLRRLRVRARPR